MLIAMAFSLSRGLFCAHGLFMSWSPTRPTQSAQGHEVLRILPCCGTKGGVPMVPCRGLPTWLRTWGSSPGGDTSRQDFWS